MSIPRTLSYLFKHGILFCNAEDDDANHAVLARFGDAGCEYAALISLHGTPVRMPLNAPEGAYPELISGRDICAGAWVETDGEPVILKAR